MVDDARLPCSFNPMANRGHAAARLAGDDDFGDGAVVEPDLVLGGDFGEVKGVGWRAAEHGDFGVMDELDTGEAREAAAGNHEYAARDE